MYVMVLLPDYFNTSLCTLLSIKDNKLLDAIITFKKKEKSSLVLLIINWEYRYVELATALYNNLIFFLTAKFLMHSKWSNFVCIIAHWKQQIFFIQCSNSTRIKLWSVSRLHPYIETVECVSSTHIHRDCVIDVAADY